MEITRIRGEVVPFLALEPGEASFDLFGRIRHHEFHSVPAPARRKTDSAIERTEIAGLRHALAAIDDRAQLAGEASAAAEDAQSRDEELLSPGGSELRSFAGTGHRTVDRRADSEAPRRNGARRELRLGHGSTFIVTLPLLTPKPGEQRLPPKRRSGRVRRTDPPINITTEAKEPS
jgi:hypothetical protein